MKKLALKTYGKFVAGILSFFGMLFGFSNCVKESPAEYGMPHADYIVKGTVKSASDSSAINNIQMLIAVDSVYYGSSVKTSYAPLTSDENGDYTIYMPNTLIDKIKLVAFDMDGSENGGDFQSDTIEVAFTQSDQIEKGDGDWDMGTLQKENQNFYLKKK